MALGVQSVRAATEHRDVLRAVADHLRAGRADALRDLLSDVSARPVGPFRSEAAAIGFLRDRLVAALTPKVVRMIWLFGSRARGDARPDSDFDLLVVLRDGLEPGSYDPRRVAEPLTACGLGYDVVACPWSTFLVERDDPSSLIHRAVTEGRAIYRDLDLRRADRATA